MATSDIVEQRYVIKFLQKWEKSPTKIYDSLKKVFGESTMSQTAVFRWYQLFWDGCKSVDVLRWL